MKNNKFFLSALTLLLFFSVSTLSFAQLQAPAASPAAHVSQNVGFTKISIDYSSPAVKGRKVFGELVPFGTSWRAGANGATIIEFSTAVSIGGKNIGPGKYSVFITPQASGEWTVHLNSKRNEVYAYTKDGKVDEAALAMDDAASIKVTPVAAPENFERLAYFISAEDNKVATVTFMWSDMMLWFEVDTQVAQKMEQFKGVF
ncbi:Protein of unknown function (DUF2911) [Algoriphagus ratkowskyi]|uniref:DUF2911 domain-containing protein n=1 Tax=Algoriphagus ratkowskyi TaxID=57028 RepID=A0A2W7R9R8_9BACT|nr:DUF2911 domain-containing protein [Algoriphagus ratkowskyi]PZX57658.1 Protein of unknown function (DUF2911) [Algoriphagus ratkowskyi]TXD78929.1 DUF2911 domain-containing protein [Algoriphagus ratkowskyi]